MPAAPQRRQRRKRGIVPKGSRAPLSPEERELHAQLKADGRLKSGRCGGYVYYVVKGKQRWRRHAFPKDPRTLAQQRSRLRFAAASKAWSENAPLTEAQRVAWCADGAKRQSHPRLGQSGPLTGQQNFIRRNCAMKQHDSEMLMHPREREQQKVKNKAPRPEVRFFAAFSARLLIAYAGQHDGSLGLAGANVRGKGTGSRLGPRRLPACHTSVNPGKLAWLRGSPTFCPAPLATCHQPVLRKCCYPRRSPPVASP